MYFRSGSDKPQDTNEEPIEDDPLLTPSSNDSAIAIESNSNVTEIMRTLPTIATTNSGGSDMNAIETFNPKRSQITDEMDRNASQALGG